MLPVISHVAGDDRDYDFAMRDAAGDPENVTGYAFWFTVKTSDADSDADALFQLKSADGGIVVDAIDQGIGRILVRSPHTKGKPAGKYPFDFQVRKGPSGHPIETLVNGTFLLSAEITQAE